MSPTILIVEDEGDLAAIVADYVVAAGFKAEVIADGIAALAGIRRTPPDLIVLDLMLPGLDGLAVCRAVRAFSDVPILMLTARVEEIDRLLGLEAGADDYVCKPFSPRELVARIKTILRRSHGPEARRPLVEIDEAAHAARIGPQTLDLTPSEYNMFAAMAKRPGTAFSRAQLLDIARRDNLDVSDRAIDTHIKNLRRKLATALPGVEIIHSIYGLGYRVDL
ncbi:MULTISPECIES: response regulator [Rhodanobacter]|uniref:Response regulator n=1 Tax=Rhodanobacter hydrolyticus TaxID=2250595 RepID=A0ABW8J1U6_9GAMM|nr:response regulator [Rhodanobacter sp. 7MK24]MBD8882250.1 response regulator [Rhodanobacter sp. 7MK24]